MITLDKIMLPKHKALSSAWGDEKQQQWGILTGIAIEMISDKLKRGELRDIQQVLNYVTQYRQFVGTVLAHNAAVGQNRDTPSTTPIENHPKNPLRDMLPEFSDMVGNLTSTQSDTVKVGASGDIRLYGKTFKSSYPRTAVTPKDTDFIIEHTHPVSFPVMHQKANDLFLKLKGSHSLEASEKEKIIKGIYYYLADAMPFCRGSSSIMQILYYALEDAYLGKMNYLGKMASKFGHAQGVTPDLAAMLSPSLDDFIDYLDKYIIDPSIEVKKFPESAQAMEQTAILSQRLEIELNKTRDQLTNTYPFKKAKFDHRIGGYPTNPWMDNLAFLQSLLKEHSNNPQALLNIQTMLNSLINALRLENPFRYIAFYDKLPDKGTWPAPAPIPHMPLEGETKHYIHDLKQLATTLSGYSYACKEIQDPKNKSSHYYEGSSVVGNIKNTANAKEKDAITVLAECFDHITDNQKEVSQLISEFIDVILMMERDIANKIPKEVTIEALLDMISAKTEKEYDLNKTVEKYRNNQLNSLRNSLREIYDQASQLKLSLNALKPLLSNLSLPQQTRDLIFGEPQRDEKDTTFTEALSSIEVPMMFNDLRETYTTEASIDGDQHLLASLKTLDVGHGVIAAIRLGYKDWALDLISQSDKEINLDVCDALGYTPLMWAIKTSDQKLISRILQSKPNLDVVDKFGNTALWHAMHLGQEQAVSALLAMDPPPNLDMGGIGGSPCQYISNYTCPKHIPKLLLPHMNTVQLQQVMHQFAKSGKVDLLRICIEFGADLSQRDSNGMTLLMNACECSKIESIELVLKNNPDLDAKNSKNQTALMLLCASSNLSPESIKALIAAGADVHAVDLDNMTPMSLILKNINNQYIDKSKLLECFLALHDAGCAMDEDQLNEIASVAVEHDACHVLKSLLERVESPYLNKEEAFYEACYYGNQNVAELLLEKNADPLYLSEHNNTCLIIGAFGQNKWIIQTLLERGVDINHQGRRGATALLYAAQDGAQEIVSMLLDHGADMSLANEDGKTALEIAFENGHTEIVKLLNAHKEKLSLQGLESKKPNLKK